MALAGEPPADAARGGFEVLRRDAVMGEQRHQRTEDATVLDGLWCSIEDCHMGTHAERVAIRSGVSREDQDAFALDSHRKAAAAQDAGRFADEMAPVTIRDAKGREAVVDADEGVRRDTTSDEVRAEAASAQAEIAGWNAPLRHERDR